MKLALLGAHPDALALVRAAAKSADHQVVSAAVPARADEDLTRAALGVVPTHDWVHLLAGKTADAVIVAPAESDELDGRADQLRKLIQARVPVLAVHPVHPSLLIHYELESMRGEPPAVLVPYLPWREHPAVARLRELCRSGESSDLGALEQVVIERYLTTRTAETVARQFAIDVDIAQQFTGDLAQLGAMAPGATAAEQAPQYTNLGLQAFGASGVMLRWSVGPVEEQPGLRITLLGSRGKATLDAPDGQPWKLEWKLRDPESETASAAQVEEFPVWDPAGAGLRALQQALDGQPPAANWDAATRAVELAEAIQRSLHRRRTVDVKRDEPNESSAFKGNMIAFGCSLLMLMLPVFVFGVVLGNSGYVRTGRVLLYFGFGLLGLFLVVQLLGLLATRTEPPKT